MGLKYAIVKNKPDIRLFNTSRFYKDLPKDEEIFDQIRSLSNLGILLGLKADFFILTNKVDLEEYDVIIDLDHPPEELRTRKDQIICYMPREPAHRGRSPRYFDILLDNFILPGDPLPKYGTTISFLYKYPVSLMRKFIQEKGDLKVFLQHRTSLKHNRHTNKEAFGERPFREYFRVLSSSKYLFNLDISISAGQIIAESAILDVVSIAKRHRIFQRLCFPDWCHVDDESGLLAVFERLEGDEHLYDRTLEFSRRWLRSLDCKGLDKVLENQIEDA